MTLDQNPDAPVAADAQEVRAALERVLASEAFRGSAQLVAFLRFVVEAALRGEGDRIKGYTIAIEALGRNQDFDPQIDPIVRVEAARLRRAIDRYYAGEGADDPLQIELPRGSYVPVFRARDVRETGWPARLRGAIAYLLVDHHRLAAALVLLVIGAAIYGLVDFLVLDKTPRPPDEPTLATTGETPASPWRSRPALPVVAVEPFQVAGTPAVPQAALAALRGRIRDALARFDDIVVVTDPAGAAPAARSPPDGGVKASEYRLAATAELREDGALRLSFRLIAASGVVAWTRSYERVALDGKPGGDEEAVVREVTATLAQPYGIIQAYEHAQPLAEGGDPRRRCLFEAYAYWRNYDPLQHARARDCLERAVESDPAFSLGFAVLAPLYLDEYRNATNTRAGEPALDRALKTARRAVELKPGSARAHETLMDVHFVRREYPQALAAGEKALALNPYDPDIVADLGARLVASGEVARGARLLREASATIMVRPAWHDFYLFLAAYLAGDQDEAARYASLILTDTFPLGIVARALAAAERGDGDHARQLLDRLGAARPGWRADPRRELEKFFPAAHIVDRLAGALARIKAGATN